MTPLSYIYETKIVVRKTSYVKVDLNDYFDPEEADWNYTELNDSEWEYLRNKNIFFCDTTIGNNELKGWYYINRWMETQNTNQDKDDNKGETFDSGISRNVNKNKYPWR